MSRPSLSVRRAGGEVGAVALLCYGGKAKSRQPSRPWHVSALRLASFAASLARGGSARGLEVMTLRYRQRGWNGGEGPVADARWALDQVTERHGDVPVVLVGHSMGGRVALRAARHPQVRGVVALAPWLDESDPHRHLAGRRLLIVHGTADRWTSPAQSLAFAEKVEALEADVRRVELPGLGHFMLRRTRLWHAITRDTVLDWLSDELRESSNRQARLVYPENRRSVFEAPDPSLRRRRPGTFWIEAGRT